MNVSQNWTLASTHFGIKTYYRREEDGTLSVQLEGSLENVPLFEQICVLKEVDLHYKWSPFCTASMTVADLGKLDTVGWFLVGMASFGLSRDGCFRAIGCDCTKEDGSVLLTAQGIRDVKPGAPAPDNDVLRGDPVMELLEIPAVPKRRGSGRMTIRKFDAIVRITSPTSCVTRLVANVDPNIDLLPQSLLEFILKHLAGVLLAKLQGAAKKVSKHPITNEHARKMRDEREFYQGWLMAKFQALCKDKGWEMPKVPAFELTDEEQLKDDAVRRRKVRRGSIFAPSHTLPSEFESEISARSSPVAMGHNDSGSVSDISTGSSHSRWSNNPIGKFLREREERAEVQKTQKVAAIRTMAAERLRPKEMDPKQLSRLEALRAARAHRSVPVSHVSSPRAPQAADVDRKPSFSHRITLQIHQHGWMTRFVVMSVLFGSLFALLHAPVLDVLSSGPISRVDPWAKQLLEDGSAVLYMTLSTVLHFVLCDVSLVYAFGSLELGSKAGRQIKKFYSETARLAVAVASFGMLLASIGKAVGKVMLRKAAWGACLVFDQLSNGAKWLGQNIPSTILTSVSFVVTSISKGVTTVFSVPLAVVRFLYQLFQESLAVRSARYTIRSVGATVGYMVGAVDDFISHSCEVIEGRQAAIPWRVEAFDFLRSLFLYSGVFLVVTLILFNFTARRRRSTKSSSSNVEDEPVESQLSDLDTHVSALTLDDEPVLSMSPPRMHETIPEDEELIVGGGAPILQVRSDEIETKATRRRRRMFGMSRSKTQSMSAVVDPHEHAPLKTVTSM